MILYIHGFGSSGEAYKASQFRRFCAENNIRFLAPSLPTVPDLAIRTLEELVETLRAIENIAVIGSSLGGYYSMYLSSKYAIPCVLINPAVYPYVTLRRAIGMVPNYYDHTLYEWKESHLEMLKRFEIEGYRGKNALLLVQKGDEVLDSSEAVEKLTDAEMIVEEGGDHAFQGIERHFQRIVEFFQIREGM